MSKGSGRARPRDKAGRRRLPLRKKLAFSLATTVVLLAILEGALALVGIQPLLVTHDPFVGFASNIRLFVEAPSAADGRVMITSPGKLDYFNAQRFARQKPTGTYRIFCLGGSTTYGRPYDDATSSSGWLRELLPAVAPATQWEVINAGGVSYASYRVAAVMEELSSYEPDLFVIYTGHNEFLEQRTYGELRSVSPVLQRMSGALAHTRTCGLMQRLLDSGSRVEANRCQLPGEVDAILDQTVGPASYQRDDEWRRGVFQHFEYNLNRMSAVARSCGAEIVFVVPASNLKDCSPFKSQHSDCLTPRQIGQFRIHVQKGDSLARSEKLTEALLEYGAALEVDDRFADLHFKRGKTLFAAERLPEAAVAFRLAIDEDVCPLRAPTDVSRIVRETAEHVNVSVVDFEELLRNECLKKHGHNAPGREYFLDHVHPTIETNRLLALAIIDAISRVDAINGGGDVADAAIAGVSSRIYSRINVEKHAEALRNLAKVLNWAGKHEEAGPLALRVLETLPNDPESLALAAAYATSQGDIDPAIEMLEKAVRHAPQYAEARRLLVAALVERGDLVEAYRQARRLLLAGPKDPETHHMAGAILAELDRFEEALPHYRVSLQGKPDDPSLHYNLALALDSLGQPTEAIRHYGRAIQLDPDDAVAHNRLGELLAAIGRFSDAIRHFREALRIRPDCDEFQENLRTTMGVQSNTTQGHHD